MLSYRSFLICVAHTLYAGDPIRSEAMLPLHSVADGTFAQFTISVDDGYGLLLVSVVAR